MLNSTEHEDLQLELVPVATLKALCLCGSAIQSVVTCLIMYCGKEGGKHDLKCVVQALLGWGPPKAAESSLPSVSDIAGFLLQVHPNISKPADPGEQIILKPKAFIELLKFIEVCKKHSLLDDLGQTEQSIVQKMHRG